MQVTLVGSLQDEVGCESDWDPACEQSGLTETEPGRWSLTASVPAGSYELKVAIDGESLWMAAPLHFRVAPQRLHLVVPPHASAEHVPGGQAGDPGQPAPGR